MLTACHFNQFRTPVRFLSRCARAPPSAGSPCQAPKGGQTVGNSKRLKVADWWSKSSDALVAAWPTSGTESAPFGGHWGMGCENPVPPVPISWCKPRWDPQRGPSLVTPGFTPLLTLQGTFRYMNTIADWDTTHGTHFSCCSHYLYTSSSTTTTTSASTLAGSMVWGGGGGGGWRRKLGFFLIFSLHLFTPVLRHTISTQGWRVVCVWRAHSATKAKHRYSKPDGGLHLCLCTCLGLCLRVCVRLRHTTRG